MNSGFDAWMQIFLDCSLHLRRKSSEPLPVRSGSTSSARDVERKTYKSAQSSPIKGL
jgi:hypothetical protein